MAIKSVLSSREKNILLLYVIDMIIMVSKGVVLTVFSTSVVFKIVANLSYLSLFFPKQDFLLALLYFFLCIILFSVIFGIVLSFGWSKEEILQEYSKKDNWMYIKLF